MLNDNLTSVAEAKSAGLVQGAWSTIWLTLALQIRDDLPLRPCLQLAGKEAEGSGKDLDPTNEQAINKLFPFIGWIDHPRGCYK